MSLVNFQQSGIVICLCERCTVLNSVEWKMGKVNMVGGAGEVPYRPVLSLIIVSGKR